MHNILYVDDCKDFRKLVEIWLNEKYYYFQTDNHLKALYYLKSKEFDLIILDYNMPVVNGVELAKLIRYNQVHTPILFFTSDDLIKNNLTDDISGEVSYLKKSGNKHHFLKVVDHLIFNNEDSKIYHTVLS